MRLRYAVLAAVLSAPAALLAPAAAQAQTVRLADLFDYRTGDLAGQGGWAAQGSAGLTPIQVQAANLDFVAAYPTSPGGSIRLAGGEGGREDLHRTFAPVTSGSVYAAAVVSVASAPATSDFFFHLGGTPIGTNTWRGRVGLVANGTGFSFTFYKGNAGTNGENILVEPTVRSFNRAYLVVIKYTLAPDGTNNDAADLIVQSLTSNVPAEPRTPTLSVNVVSEASSDITPASVAFRQGTGAYSLTVDGLRVATAWPGSSAVDADAPLRPADDRLHVAGQTVRVAAVGSLDVGVYDVLGRRVATLFDGDAAGEVRAALPTLPTGVYLVRARGEGFDQSASVVVR